MLGCCKGFKSDILPLPSNSRLDCTRGSSGGPEQLTSPSFWIPFEHLSPSVTAFN